MKKIFLSVLMISLSMISFAQVDDDYQKFVNEYNKGIREMQKEMDDYVAKANADFADFVAKEWKLFEDFKSEQLSMTTPKPKEIPTAKPVDEPKEEPKTNVRYTQVSKLPAVTNSTSVGGKLSSLVNSYVIKRRLGDNESKVVVKQTLPDPEPVKVSQDAVLKINFYGCMLDIPFDNNLRVHVSGTKENDVAKYFNDMTANAELTKALWSNMSGIVNEFGLNEWGYYCLLRSISDKVFENEDDKVMFCFYMLRNEGNFKTRIARGKDTNSLLLLIAIDNKLDVYSYSFFRFNDNDTQVKYYTIFGGNGKEAIYSYDFCKQDAEKKQMSLDFNHNLNMGKCDVERNLELTKDVKVTLPYNSAHIAYLNDVPMTVFPIYFASPISIEAQKILSTEFTKLSKENTPYQFINMLLHFVQTGFEYKTDEDQFGYEKYFYPEEVIAYPYSDCEDRAALFSWLVTTYTDAKVIGLLYEGHVATAVYFGDDFNIEGDRFIYGGKKYYVCDPTFINASVGMSMPQFAGKTPKVIKLKKAAN